MIKRITMFKNYLIHASAKDISISAPVNIEQNRERGSYMILREYPKHIDELFKIVMPYKKEIFNEDFNNIPENVLQAYHELKKWASSLGQ